MDPCAMRRANATCAGGERIDKDDVGAPDGKRRQCIYYYSQRDVERRDLICCSCHVEVTSSGPCNKYEEWRHGAMAASPSTTGSRIKRIFYSDRAERISQSSVAGSQYERAPQPPEKPGLHIHVGIPIDLLHAYDLV